jgi:hypothetical protein
MLLLLLWPSKELDVAHGHLTCCIDDEEDIADSQKPFAISLSLTLHNPRVSQVDRYAIPSGASEFHSTAISLAPSQLVDFLVEEFELLAIALNR